MADHIFFCNYCDLVSVRIVGNEACRQYFEEYFVGLVSDDSPDYDYTIRYAGVITNSIDIPNDARRLKGFAAPTYSVWRSGNLDLAYAARDEYRGAHLVVRDGREITVSVEHGIEDEEMVVRIAREVIFRKALTLGFVPFHAAAVVYQEDRCVVFCGPRDSGKTTSLILACHYGDASPLGSDMVLMRRTKGTTEVCGWPFKVSYVPRAHRLISHQAGILAGADTKSRVTPHGFCVAMRTRWVWRATLSRMLAVRCDYVEFGYQIRPVGVTDEERVRRDFYDAWHWGDFLRLGDTTPDVEALYPHLAVEAFSGNMRTYMIEQTVSEVVSSQYFPGVDVSVARTGLGQGATFRVRAGDVSYFAKLLDRASTKEDGELEVRAVEVLRNAGLPVPRYVSTIDGGRLYSSERYQVVVQEWVDAEPVPKYSVDDIYLLESVDMLGRIAVALDGLSLPRRLDGLFGACDDRPVQIAQLIDGLAKRGDDADAASVRIALEERLRLIEIVSRRSVDMERITFVNSHGDFSVLQTMKRNGSLFKVVDFSRVSNVPAIWEVIRSYSYGSPECADCEIDEKRLRQYVEAYRAHVRLTDYDLHSMKLLYATQLLKSSFGFEEFVASGVKDNLAFALWRVRFARALLEQIE